MIFWLCTIIYVIIGVVVGRLIYNDGLDSAYEYYLEGSKNINSISWSTEQHQKWAFQKAKSEDYPIFWSWILGVGWLFALPVLLAMWIFVALSAVVDKILPKSSARKAMKALEEKEKRDAIEAEYQKQLKIVEEYNK